MKCNNYFTKMIQNTKYDFYKTYDVCYIYDHYKNTITKAQLIESSEVTDKDMKLKYVFQKKKLKRSSIIKEII